MAVAEQLEEEVKQFAGERYSRQGDYPEMTAGGAKPDRFICRAKKCVLYHSGLQQSKEQGVVLYSRQALRSPLQADEGFLRRISLDLPCHNYASCAEAVP